MTARTTALAGVVVGGLALRRTAGQGDRRRWSLVALVAGAVGAVGGGLVLAVADGGPGTGNGVVGAGAALVLGLVATGLGLLVRTRDRRNA